MRTRTRQEELYEEWYHDGGDDFGLPDLKVGDAIRKPSARILSIGGGQGNDLWYLAGQHSVTVADYASNGLRSGMQHGLSGVRLDLNAGRTVPFADDSFDVVVCKDILEHVMDPLAVLEEAGRVLRPGGQLIVNVPNHFYFPMRFRIVLGHGLIWRSFFADHRDAYDEWDYMHIRFFTYKGIKRLLRRAGFVPRRFYWDLGALGHYTNPDMWLAPQIAKRKKGKPLSRRGRLALLGLLPLWRVFNMVVPRPIRALIVSMAPGLLSASFYVRCEVAPDGRGW